MDEYDLIAWLRGCQGGNCPTIRRSEETAIVQGYIITDPAKLAALNLPEGESAVEIPLDLLRNVTKEDLQ